MLYTMRPIRLTVGLTWRRRSLINLDLTRNTGSVRFHSIKLDSSPITGSPAALDISFTPEHSSSSHSYSHFLTCQRWNVAGGHGPPGSHSRRMQRCSVKTSCSLQRRIWMNFFLKWQNHSDPCAFLRKGVLPAGFGSVVTFTSHFCNCSRAALDLMSVQV